MEMLFTSYDVLSRTDYWDIPEGAESGRAWLQVQGRYWHALLPKPIRCEKPAEPVHRASISPVRDPDEPGGWCWLLIVWDGIRKRTVLRQKITSQAILGRPPGLPKGGESGRARLIIYRNEAQLIVGAAGATDREHELQKALECRLNIVRLVAMSEGRWGLHGRCLVQRNPPADGGKS